MTEYYKRKLSGRGHCGNPHGIVHAVPDNKFPSKVEALCGAKPTNSTWESFERQAITCPKCIKKIEKLTVQP